MGRIDLRTFKANIPNGIARKNRYEVIVDGMPEDISTFCLSAQLPGMTMGVASGYFQGRQLKLAGDPRYPNWAATYYGNSGVATIESYQEFLKWYNEPRDQVSNVGKNNPHEYWRRVTIRPLADDGTTILGEIVLLDAFVAELQPVDISYENENELLTFNVILEFSETTIDGAWTG